MNLCVLLFIPGPSTDLRESYVGCCKDHWNPRYLGGHFQDFNGSLNPERCVGLCYRLGFLYAGLQYALSLIHI